MHVSEQYIIHLRSVSEGHVSTLHVYCRRHTCDWHVCANGTHFERSKETLHMSTWTIFQHSHHATYIISLFALSKNIHHCALLSLHALCASCIVDCQWVGIVLSRTVPAHSDLQSHLRYSIFQIILESVVRCTLMMPDADKHSWQWVLYTVYFWL